MILSISRDAAESMIREDMVHMINATGRHATTRDCKVSTRSNMTIENMMLQLESEKVLRNGERLIFNGEWIVNL